MECLFNYHPTSVVLFLGKKKNIYTDSEGCKKGMREQEKVREGQKYDIVITDS